MYCLLDSGALGNANFLSNEVAKLLIQKGAKTRVVRQTVASAFTDVSCTSSEVMSFCVILKSEIDSRKIITLKIEAFLIDSPLDLIIGRQTIKNYNLSVEFPSHFQNLKASSTTSRSVRGEDVLPSAQYPHDSPVVVRPVVRLTALQLRTLYSSAHDDGLADSEWHAPAFEGFESVTHPPTTVEDFISLMTIEEDDELKKEDIIALLREFSDIFSETLTSEPALIPPLELTVDDSLWHKPKHHSASRPQTASNQLEIHTQLDRLLSQNIIRPSSAAYFSQVHLAEKPPKGSGQKRFCIDYVLLNTCTTFSENWPLPNIQQMLRRIGSTKPKYFAVFDLTAGYHQAPVSMNSIAYTAFICFCGLYEYLRVPFGLKGAPSYFQKMMTTVVLAGLIMVICEVNIDDIIIYACTALEFLVRLRKVFEKIREHKLLFHPKKARIGMKSIEYTGHMVDNTGLSFSPKKIQCVLDFPIPVMKQQIKMFLGLANYFRDHIRNHSNLAAPLQALIKDYSKKRDAKKPVILDDAGLSAFNNIKEQIQNCPKLFFLDDFSPVVMYTDASKYGISCYVAQRVTQPDKTVIEHPIVFMSESLTVTQVEKWKIPQKESYAIYKGLVKFEYLLRDRRFTAY